MNKKTYLVIIALIAITFMFSLSLAAAARTEEGGGGCCLATTTWSLIEFPTDQPTYTAEPLPGPTYTPESPPISRATIPYEGVTLRGRR